MYKTSQLTLIFKLIEAFAEALATGVQDKHTPSG